MSLHLPPPPSPSSTMHHLPHHQSAPPAPNSPRSILSASTPASPTNNTIRVSRTPPLPTSHPTTGRTISGNNAVAVGGFSCGTKFDLSGLNILMVDDMALNRKVLRKMLEHIPHVDVACDGLEAVHYVRHKLEQGLKIQLPPIANLDQLLRENTQSTGNDTPWSTPCPTPTSATTPSTPFIMASPDAMSSGEQAPTVVVNGPQLVTTDPTTTSLPTAEETVERHHSFPPPTFLNVDHHGPPWNSASPPNFVHQNSTGTTRSNSFVSDLSPTSCSTPMVMPATPTMLSPASHGRRYSLPIISKPPLLNSKLQYDVIITDLCMPKLNGLQEVQLIRQLEQDFNLPPVPIIAVTTNTLLSDRLACARLDFNYFLPKPFCRKDLFGVLELIVHERTQQHHSLNHWRRALLHQQLAMISITQPSSVETTPVHEAIRPRGGCLPQFTMLPAPALTVTDEQPVERQMSISTALPTPSPPSTDSGSESVTSSDECSSTISISSHSSDYELLSINRFSVSHSMNIPSVTSPIASNSSVFQSMVNQSSSSVSPATLMTRSLSDPSNSAERPSTTTTQPIEANDEPFIPTLAWAN